MFLEYFPTGKVFLKIIIFKTCTGVGHTKSMHYFGKKVFSIVFRKIVTLKILGFNSGVTLIVIVFLVKIIFKMFKLYLYVKCTITKVADIVFKKKKSMFIFS